MLKVLFLDFIVYLLLILEISMAMKAKVAIVGGGISGLSVAKQLNERGFLCQGGCAFHF